MAGCAVSSPLLPLREFWPKEPTNPPKFGARTVASLLLQPPEARVGRQSSVVGRGPVWLLAVLPLLICMTLHDYVPYLIICPTYLLTYYVRTAELPQYCPFSYSPNSILPATSASFYFVPTYRTCFSLPLVRTARLGPTNQPWIMGLRLNPS